MTDERMAVVRRWIDAWERQDVRSLLELGRDDIVVDWSRSLGPEAGMYTGLAGARRLFDAYAEVFDSFEMEYADPVPVGERVVMPNVARVRSRGGIETRAASALVFEFDGRLVERLTMYQTAEEAMAAVGAPADPAP